MISFLADHNFNEHIVDGLTRRMESLDLVLARHVGLAEESDPVVLEWAAMQDRVLLTHDARTIPPFASARIIAGQHMPGVFLVSDRMPIGEAIEELVLAIEVFTPEECADRVQFFPL